MTETNEDVLKEAVAADAPEPEIAEPVAETLPVEEPVSAEQEAGIALETEAEVEGELEAEVEPEVEIELEAEDGDLVQADAAEEPVQEEAPAPVAPEVEKESVGIGNLIVVGIFSIILGVLLCLPTMHWPKESVLQYDISGGVAATVNGVEIGENDITDYVQRYRASQGLDDDAAWGEWLAGAGYTAEQLRSDTVNLFVSRELVAQAAAEEGIEVTDEAIDAQEASTIEQVGGKEAYEQALADQGITAEDLRQDIRLGLMQQELIKKVGANAEPMSDEELLEILKAYYPDDVSQDVKSLDEVDEQLVSSTREMIAGSAQEQAYSEWMNTYSEKADVKVNDMPEGLSYAVSAAEPADDEAQAEGEEAQTK